MYVRKHTELAQWGIALHKIENVCIFILIPNLGPQTQRSAAHFPQSQAKDLWKYTAPLRNTIP